jgi:hypothetical protein
MMCKKYHFGSFVPDRHVRDVFQWIIVEEMRHFVIKVGRQFKPGDKRARVAMIAFFQNVLMIHHFSSNIPSLSDTVHGHFSPQTRS